MLCTLPNYVAMYNSVIVNILMVTIFSKGYLLHIRLLQYSSDITSKINNQKTIQTRWNSIVVIE